MLKIEFILKNQIKNSIKKSQEKYSSPKKIRISYDSLHVWRMFINSKNKFSTLF
jgi:hypothetical protein